MTPPSAEAVTPTKEEPKPVITETVDTETSLTVKAKPAQPDDRPTSITIGDGPLPSDRPLTNGMQAPVATELEQPVTELEKPVTTETEHAAPTETEKPVTTENVQLVPSENVQPVPGENVQPVPTENVQPVPTEDRLAGEPVAPKTEEGKVEESTDKIELPSGAQVERFVKAAPPDLSPEPHS